MLRNQVRVAQFSAVNLSFELLNVLAVGNGQCNGVYFKLINPCLGITNKRVNSYQFIISLSCSYISGQLCAILGELVCTF
jgi:hypothetical protein